MLVSMILVQQNKKKNEIKFLGIDKKEKYHYCICGKLECHYCRWCGTIWLFREEHEVGFLPCTRFENQFG